MDFDECEERSGFGHLRVWCHNLDASGGAYSLEEEVRMWTKNEVDVVLIQIARFKPAALATSLVIIRRV